MSALAFMRLSSSISRFSLGNIVRHQEILSSFSSHLYSSRCIQTTRTNFFWRPYKFSHLKSITPYSSTVFSPEKSYLFIVTVAIVSSLFNIPNIVLRFIPEVYESVRDSFYLLLSDLDFTNTYIPGTLREDQIPDVKKSLKKD